MYQKSFRHRLRERCVILTAAAAAAVCIAFYRHPGWGRGRAKGGFVREGNEGLGRRGRDRTQTQPFFSALLHRSSPKHPPPRPPPPAYHYQRSPHPAGPPSRSSPRPLTNRRVRTRHRAQHPYYTYTYIHAHARLPFFWSRARAACTGRNFFLISAPLLKWEGIQTVFVFCPVHRFPTGPLSVVTTRT